MTALKRREGHRTIVLLGAARSGTKLLRSLIAASPRVDAIPYDINYVWRFGNEGHPDDELTAEMLTPRIARRIRRYLDGFATGRDFLVEKTVSNCLRVPFVAAVLPEATFIHLRRDPLDVIESAVRQWSTPAEGGYILRKARTFPIFRAPGYALRYACREARRAVSGSRTRSIWGPRYTGIEDDLRTRSLEEVCALQWRRCVTAVDRDLPRVVPPERRLEVRYEDLVSDPVGEMARVSERLGLPELAKSAAAELVRVRTNEVGKGERTLSREQIAILRPLYEASDPRR